MTTPSFLTLACALLALTPAVPVFAETNTGSGKPKPDENPQRQIYITSKIIETHTPTTVGMNDWRLELDKHTILTDPQCQILIRALSRQKGADLLTAPSITTRHGQRAKIEVVQEIRHPSALDDGELEFSHSNAGVTLEVEPEIAADDEGPLIKIVGSAIVRAPDGGSFSKALNPDATPPVNDPGEDPAPISAISFLTSETFFNVELRSRETVVLVCNKHQDDPGQLLITLTATLIDPSGTE